MMKAQKPARRIGRVSWVLPYHVYELLQERTQINDACNGYRLVEMSNSTLVRSTIRVVYSDTFYILKYSSKKLLVLAVTRLILVSNTTNLIIP